MKRTGITCCTFFLAVALCGAEEVDFSLPDIGDTVVSLSDYRGKVVVLDFWATWCAACYKAFPILNELQKTLEDEGVVIGINLEKIDDTKLAGFVEKTKIRYPVLKDPKGETAKQFGIKGLPSLVVIDTSGSVVTFLRGMEKDTEERLQHALDSLLTKQ